MIQRIQTIYLGVTAVMLFVVAAAMDLAGASTDIVLMIGVVAGGAMALVSLGSVFLFSNRPKQRLVVRGIQFGCLVPLLAVGYTLFARGKLDVTSSAKDGALLVAAIACFVALWLLRRAALAIKKDILLIKSMDRIR